MTTQSKASGSSRASTPKSSDWVEAVYGEPAIVIGEGPRAMMQGYVDRLNEQAPIYKHTIREVPA